MARDIAVGLLGFGCAGATFHAPLIAATPGLALARVASSRPAAVRAALPDVEVVTDSLAVATDDGIDLVVIATPNATHVPLAAAALRAGKHVVVDKPLSLDLTEARALATLAAEVGRTLCAFQNRRYDSDYLTVLGALEKGTLGSVARFVSRIDRFRPSVRDRWREGDDSGAGLLYDLGPHLVDQAIALFGLPDDVGATLALQRPGARSDDAFELVLRYGARVVALGGSMLAAGGSPRFAVHGQRGSLVKSEPDVQETQLRAGMAPGAPGWGVDPDAAVAFDGATGETRAIAATPGDQRSFYLTMRDAVLGEGDPPISVAQSIGVAGVLDAARRSHAEGRRIVPALDARERDGLTSLARCP